MRHNKTLPAAAALFALALALPATEAWAVRLDETAIFIEINDTDGDAGIQIFLDGEGWDRMTMTNPDGRREVVIKGKGGVGLQGLTEAFFESAEPSFDEQPLDEFLGLFPPGIYRFSGRTTEGDPLTGRARLTHILPAAPIIVRPADGDAVDPDDTVVEWMPVADPAGSEIVKYEVIVEFEEPELRVFKADLPADATSITVPPEFMNGGGEEAKVEVIVQEDSGNQVITEHEFELE